MLDKNLVLLVKTLICSQKEKTPTLNKLRSCPWLSFIDILNFTEYPAWHIQGFSTSRVFYVVSFSSQPETEKRIYRKSCGNEKLNVLDIRFKTAISPNRVLFEQKSCIPDESWLCLYDVFFFFIRTKECFQVWHWWRGWSTQELVGKIIWGFVLTTDTSWVERLA